MERVQEFESAARSVGVEVVHLDRESLEAGVSSYLQELRVERISVDSDQVRLADFERAELATADCGVTDVAWGIASTGTLAIPMTAGNRRSTSLLPPVHVALLDKDTLLADLGSALRHMHQNLMKFDDRPSSVVFVTGASRTADIELELIVGVHGPCALHVVLF